MIKLHNEHHKQQVESIEDLRLAVDSFYPRITVLYELNGRQVDNDLTEVFNVSYDRER